MSGLWGNQRRRRLFTSPARRRRSVPEWAWIPFAALATVLGLLAALRALGVDGPAFYRWLTDPRQPLVPALFLGSIVAAAALYGRARSAAGRVIGVLSVSSFAIGALVLGMASYINCAPDGPPFFEPLIWVLSGNGAAPWGAGPGCPTEAPLAAHLARLCALWGALAGVLGVVAAMLRRQIDRWLALLARRSVVVLGQSAEAAGVLRALAVNLAPGTSLLVIDSAKDEGFVAGARALGARVLAADTVDTATLVRLVSRRGRIAAESVQIIEDRVPEALATFTRVAKALDAAQPNEGLITRVLVRIDDPWAAENWRRSMVGPERAWLADALSATEQTARAVVARIDLIGARRLVLAGEGDLAAAVLAEVAQCERERRVLQTTTAQPLQVTLVGEHAADLAKEHIAQQARFGNDKGIEFVQVIAEPATDAVLIAAGSGELTTLLVIAEAAPALNRPTRIAGRVPDVTIMAVDPGSTELPEQPLLGRLTSFGVGLQTGDEVPEDHWTRMARLLHNAYLAQLGDGVGARPSSRPWPDLPVFYRDSNLRQVHTLFSGVVQVGRTWAADGAGEPLSPAEIDFLSRREHDSWRRFYLANGWRQAPARDDTRLLHDWLVDWDALPPPARARTSAGVRRPLALPDVAGYRSQKITALVPHRRRGEVLATQLDHEWTWQTATGDTIRARPGDWQVTDPETGRQWSADPAAFHAGHEPVGAGRYRRTGFVLARPAHLGEQVNTMEGPAVAEAGEWLVEGDLQERWLVPGARFTAAYEAV